MHIIFDTPGGVGLYFSYNIFAWMIVTTIIALGLWQISLNRKIYYSKLLLWLSAGCIFLVIPAFYPFEFTDHAIPRILALLGGLLFLFTFYQFNLTKRDAISLLAIILFSAVLEACFGLVQFFIFEEGDWGGYIVGKSRPHGVFLQPNVMASYMATGFAIALFLSVKKVTSKVSRFPLAYVHPAYISFSLFVTSFLLVLLQSRTGFVGAIAVLLLITPYLFQKNKKQLFINLSIISIAVFSALISLESSKVPIRADEVYEEVGPRKAQFLISLDMIKEKPLLGYGYGGFERGFIDHFNDYAKEHPELLENPKISDIFTRMSHPHNEVLFWVVEGGVITIFAFICFTLGYYLTWRNTKFLKDLALLSLVFPLLLHSQLEFPFYSSASHFLVFLIMLWLIDLYALKPNENFKSIECNATFLIRFFALFIPCIFIPFLATTLQTANILVEHEKSGSKSLARFNDIINPIAWQSRLDAAVYAHIFVSGVRDKDIEKLKQYLIWALKRIKHNPRVILYKNCLMILKALGQNEAYELLLSEAKKTYPLQDEWQYKKVEDSRVEASTEGFTSPKVTGLD